MRWLKRERWKVSIALAGLLLLLVLMVWVPVSAASASERASGLASPGIGTVQATPTANATATMTALQEDKLQQEIKQLKEQNDPTVTASNREKLQHGNDWWWSYGATILSSFLSTFVLVVGALIGFWQWRMNRDDIHTKESNDRKEAQDKDLRAEAEERFKNAVAALGDKNEGVQVGGAILLRSFLTPSDKDIYERYYTQIFDLAVAYLRLPSTPHLSDDQDGISRLPDAFEISSPPPPLNQALIILFKEVFPLARSQNKGGRHSLDATGIQLDHAYLQRADLKQAWMPQASLRKVDFNRADLMKTFLIRANLSGAYLRQADLRGADLSEADLSEADLKWADLSEADLSEADLSGVRYLEEARSLKDTDLRRVKGLTKEQLEFCKAKEAIIDEDATPSSPQSPLSASPPAQSKSAQALSAPPAQANTPPPGADGSSTPSSKPDPES